MGACASKFKLLKSADDADPPEDVSSSRELKPAEDLIKKDRETPAAADDEHSKRQMLVNLLKADDGEAGATEHNGNESLEVKQEDDQKVKSQENETVKSAESSVTDALAKDAGLVLESRGLEDVKKSKDGKPASENVETTESQTMEEKPVEAAKIEASGKVDNQETEKPGEIGKPVEKSSLSKEIEAGCLENPVEEGAQEKHDADTTKEVGVPEVNKNEEEKPDLEWETEEKPEVVVEVSVPELKKEEEPKPILERETEKKPEVVMEVAAPEVKSKEERIPVLETETEKKSEVEMEVSMPEMVKNNEKKSASIREGVEKEQQHAEVKMVEAPVKDIEIENNLKLTSSAAAESEIGNNVGETTPTREIPGTDKPDSAVEMEIKRESDEAARLELPEKEHEKQELKETKVGVEKPAVASNEEEKSEDQPAAVGTMNIETSAKPETEDIQLVAAGTAKIEPDGKAQVDKDKQAEPDRKEVPSPDGMNKLEDKSGTMPEIETGR